MPIIFAQALLLFPSSIINMLFKQQPHGAADRRSASASGWMHYVLYAIMIFFFSYFWVATCSSPSRSPRS